MISFKETPLKNAHEVDAALTSWAVTTSDAGTLASARIAATSHRAIVSRDAGPCGGVVARNNCECARTESVRLTYHLRALTGHQSLSCKTDECDLMSGTKMSGGEKEAD